METQEMVQGSSAAARGKGQRTRRAGGGVQGGGILGVMARAYEAASRAQRLSQWNPTSGSANEVLGLGSGIIRDRARDLVRNNTWAKRAVDVIVSNTVGAGIAAQVSSKNENKKDGEEFKKLWEEWAGTTACDADGQHDFAGLQRLFLRTIAQSGDCLVRARFRRPEDGLPIPLQLQVLEGDHLDDATSLISGKDRNGNREVGGVLFDAVGRRTGYRIFLEHPGDPLTTSIESRVVPAEFVAHGYLQDRPGQVRGVSWLAAALLRLRSLDQYEDAELLRQKIAACFAAFLETPEDDAGAGAQSEIEERPYVDMLEPGTTTELPPGYQIKFAEPPKVEGYADFVRAQLRAVAASLGLTYEMLAADYSQTNYSSGRMGHLESGRAISVWQRDIVINQLCRPVMGWVMQAAQLSGRLRTRVPVQWVPPRREMVDPAKEIPMIIQAIRAGLVTFPSAIQSMGGDPDEHLLTLKETMDQLKALGLTLTIDPSRHGDKAGA